MNETFLTVVGNVATAPEVKVTAAGVPVARFRLATTSRRWDGEKAAWTDGATSFFTVRAWRTLAHNVQASVRVGEPVLVRGRLSVRQDEREGQRYVAADIDALAVGHDLSRGTTVFCRAAQARPDPLAAGRRAAAMP